MGKLPEHLTALPTTDNWVLWRCVGLRGAGFPARDVLQLQSCELAQQAQAVVIGESNAARLAQTLLEQVNASLDAVRERGAWERESQPLVEALWALKAGKLPQATGTATIDVLIERTRTAREKLGEARKRYRVIFSAETKKQQAAIQNIIRSDRFCEAIIWQNRTAFERAILPLRDRPDTIKAKKRRQKEELVAKYLQRYSVKNDTIGFFGPVGWGECTDDATDLHVNITDQLLASRTVYFELWPIDTLAKMANKDERLRRWMRPRQTTLHHIKEGVLFRPMRLPLPLPNKQVALLQLCSGAYTAETIANQLIADGIYPTCEQVFDDLHKFNKKQVLTWSFDVPRQRHPERALRENLLAIADPQLREEALRPLEQLEQGRQAVAIAAGNPTQLYKSLTALEQTFSDLTGEVPTRRDGEVYGGRTLLYEDCRRATSIEIGLPLQEQIARPLALIMDSIRWATYELAGRLLAQCATVYNALAEKNRSPIVDLTAFSTRFQPILMESQDLTKEVMAQFHDRWANILNLPSDVSVVDYNSAELRCAVESTFACPSVGWPTARYQCPDIMLAAHGDTLQPVMGEIHVGRNTLAASLWVGQHPDPSTLKQSAAHDLPDDPHLLFVVPKEWPGVTVRTWAELYTDSTYFLLFGSDPDGVPASRTIPIGELVIDKCDGKLIIRTRDNRLHFDFIAGFSDILSYFSTGKTSYGIVNTTQKTHLPRINIDGMTVYRESWCFLPRELEFAFCTDSAERYLSAQRWMHQYQIPRFIFVRTPTEAKPFFIDLTSQTYINILAKMVRLADKSKKPSKFIKLSEMLPTPDQLWLTDNTGNQYTSELRFIALETKG